MHTHTERGSTHRGDTHVRNIINIFQRKLQLELGPMSYIRNHKLPATTNKKEAWNCNNSGKPKSGALAGGLGGAGGGQEVGWGGVRGRRMRHDDIWTHKNARAGATLCLEADFCYFISTLYARRMSQLLWDSQAHTHTQIWLCVRVWVYRISSQPCANRT